MIGGRQIVIVRLSAITRISKDLQSVMQDSRIPIRTVRLYQPMNGRILAKQNNIPIAKSFILLAQNRWDYERQSSNSSEAAVTNNVIE